VAHDDRLYVADQTNHRIQVLDLQGRFLATWGKHGTKPGEFGGNTTIKSRAGGPDFVALDKQGNIYTTEAMDGRVQKFTAEGAFLLAFGDLEDRPGSFGREFKPSVATAKTACGSAPPAAEFSSSPAMAATFAASGNNREANQANSWLPTVWRSTVVGISTSSMPTIIASRSSTSVSPSDGHLPSTASRKSITEPNELLMQAASVSNRSLDRIPEKQSSPRVLGNARARYAGNHTGWHFGQ
jgi:hypothetical protein